MATRWRLFRHAAGRSAGPPASVYVLLFVASLLVGQWSVGRYGTVVVWPTNGVLLAATLQLPRRKALLVLGACFLINLASNVWRGDAPHMVAINALLNLGEVVLAGALARRFCGAALDMRRPRRLASFAFLAAAPAVAASAALGVTALHPPLNQIPVDLETWFTVELLGILIVTPSMLLLARRHRFAGVRARGWRWEPPLLLGLLSAVCAAIFAQTQAPVVFLVFPPLMLIAFRHSPVWSALSVILVAAIACGFTLNGMGPLTESALGPRAWVNPALLPVLQALPALHLFLACVVSVSLPASTMLTERRMLEARLKARNTMAMEARAAAEEALEARSRFLSMMSHEMRTPLNCIQGFTELLSLRADLSGADRRKVEGIREANGRLLALVEDILDYSRGDLAIDPSAVDLPAVVSDAVESVRPDAEAKGLTLTFTNRAERPRRHGDARRIRQVLRHLLGNAIKFTPSGCVEATLCDTPEGVQVRIADTGPGLAPPLIDQLFRPFQTGDASIGRAQGGAGIGLAFSRRLATLMGGDIAATNRPQGGALFTLRLPLPAAACPPSELASSAAPGPEAVDNAPGRAPRVLVVDDHPANRQVAVLLLEACGCQSGQACDGLEAVAAVQAESYDLVLMDVRMPNMDGLAATRAIRALPGAVGAIPIVAMTADAMPEDVARCRAAGMDDFLAKPVRIATLVPVLEHRLSGEPAEPEAVAG